MKHIKTDGFDFSNMKSTKFYICQTPGLQLWMAINSPHMTLSDEPMDEKKVLRDFNHPIEESCRCRNCRYLRIYK